MNEKVEKFYNQALKLIGSEINGLKITDVKLRYPTDKAWICFFSDPKLDTVFLAKEEDIVASEQISMISFIAETGFTITKLDSSYDAEPAPQPSTQNVGIEEDSAITESQVMALISEYDLDFFTGSAVISIILAQEAKTSEDKTARIKQAIKILETKLKTLK